MPSWTSGRVRGLGAALAAALALVTACGDGGSTAPDASPDAAAPDAGRGSFWYVMDRIWVPDTAIEATTFGLDLDGDDQPDNQLGGLLAALSGQAGLKSATAQMGAVDSGRILTIVDIDRASLDDAAAVPVLVTRGRDVDGDAADNFSGAEVFGLDPLDGAYGQLEGTLGDGEVRAGPGNVPIQLAVFGVSLEVVAMVGAGGRLAALASDGRLADGRLGAALSPEDVDEVLVPAMAAGIDSIVRRDCPDGVCDPDSDGEKLASFFDDTGDGTITVEELRSSSLISSTIGNPDLDLFGADGELDPNGDGVNDSLSIGLGFTAVAAAPPEWVVIPLSPE